MADAQEEFKPESDATNLTEVTVHDEVEILVLHNVQEEPWRVGDKVENYYCKQTCC